METEPVFLYDALPPIGDSNSAPDSPPPELASSPTPDIPFRSDLIRVGDEDHNQCDYIPLELEQEEAPPPEPQVLISEPAADKVWPWIEARSLTGSAFRSPLLQLHQEILDFCKFISPTEEEEMQRSQAVERVSECIYALWPDCKVQVFGSFATGLYLPTSDIDMVILESRCSITQNGLGALAKVLRRRGVAHKVTVIAKAKVPIVKFVESDSGISFDVSFDLKNGPEAAKFIQKQLSSLPPLRPLCMVLKIFLQQRELNEVYTGGVGSYALLVMIMAHLQLHPSRHSFSPLEANLGVLLVDFLNLYGRALNVKEVGVSCTNGGRFYSKTARGFYDKSRPFLLSVEDPQAPDNDIGKNSYKYDKVRAAFFLAHRLLMSPGSSLGILGRIIRSDKKLMSRKQLDAGDPVPGYFFRQGALAKDGDKQGKKLKQRKRKLEDVDQIKQRKAQKLEADNLKRRKQEENRKRKREENVAEEQQKRPKKQTWKNVNVNEPKPSRAKRESKWKKVEEADTSRTMQEYEEAYVRKGGQRNVVESTAFYKKVKYL